MQNNLRGYRKQYTISGYHIVLIHIWFKCKAFGFGKRCGCYCWPKITTKKNSLDKERLYPI